MRGKAVAADKAFAAEAIIAADHPLAAVGAIVELAQRRETGGRVDRAEIGATQRPGVDDTARHEPVRADAGLHEPLRLAVARHIGGIVDLEEAAVLPRPLDGIDTPLLEIIGRKEIATATFGKGDASRDAQHMVGDITMMGDAEYISALQAFEIAVEDEVDDPLTASEP